MICAAILVEAAAVKVYWSVAVIKMPTQRHAKRMHVSLTLSRVTSGSVPGANESNTSPISMIKDGRMIPVKHEKNHPVYSRHFSPLLA